MKKHYNELVKMIKEQNAKSQADTLANLKEYYSEKKPYILEGRGVRNWAKKTQAEKIKIIKEAYKKQQAEAVADIDRLTACEPFNYFCARVEWSRNYYWGYNPHAKVWVNYEHGEASASGCGYDKLSASINSALNNKMSDILKGAIYRHYIETGEKLPYCCYMWARGLCVSFGGAGASTLREILRYCGLKNWTHADMKSSDYIEARP